MPQPCTPWITGDDVADCCSVESSSGALFDLAAEQASSLLFELSGRIFSGECGPEDRAPSLPRLLLRLPGALARVRGRSLELRRRRVREPVRLLHGVLCSLAGEAVGLPGQGDHRGDGGRGGGGPCLYTIWKSRYLSRLDDGHWPYGQNLTLADTEEGTFSISYTYGADPPELGMAAAAQLGCQLYTACDPDQQSSAECVLPTGVTRVTRQGITIEKLAFTTWAFTRGRFARSGRAAGWNTGLPLVDAFLNTYNSNGLTRRPTFWAPGHRQYAQEMG